MTDDAPRSTRRRAWNAFLLFSLLMLVILTQVLVLGWGAEAVFFVTWLLLALIVQHDSRLSAAVGLAFLATCPILLIGRAEAVAEQAANYAYFFLAIGVLVQLEELLLERCGCLTYKLDLSYISRPVIGAWRRYWGAALPALRRLLAAIKWTALVRPIQIIGSVGLVAGFLWAAASGARLAVVLSLLAGAILFPAFVQGLRLGLRAMGAVWVLRAGLALVILALATLAMVWLHGLIAADRLARMEVAYDFVESLGSAQRTLPAPEGETIEVQTWTIEQIPRQVLFQHPALTGASRLAYSVQIGKGSVLAFDVATAPESWEQPGDGVTFAVYIQSGQRADQAFSTYIDPKQDEADRRWHSYTIDLGAYMGQTVRLIFETGSGPAGDNRYDWAGWGAPRLLIP